MSIKQETVQGLKHDNEKRLQDVGRDFRSDTFTIPTTAMFEAMMQASRGDDVYSEDETTNAFQDRLARLAGKEAGLYCVSGTQTNQVALRSHLLHPPHSILCDHRAHVHTNEAGGIAYHSQATTLPIVPSNGHYLRWEEDVLPNLQLDVANIHSTPTKVIELENTLSGTIFPQEEIIKISTEARKLGVIMHLDGARIWEVAAATGLSIEELCRPFDSVSLCLSKGLGAPIGSMIVGSKDFIYRALRYRKLFGGATRQVGLLVGAAEYCLDNHFPLLSGAHKLATKLAIAMAELGIRIETPVQTNMCWFDCTPLGFTVKDLISRASQLPQPVKLNGGRLVIHHQTSPQAVDDLIQLLTEMQQQYAKEAKPLSSTRLAISVGYARGDYFPSTSNGIRGH